MPSLNPSPKITRIYLPSTENEADIINKAWVDVKDRLQLSDLVLMTEAGVNDGLRVVTGVATIIEAWNIEDIDITNEDGSHPIARISATTVNRLSPLDFKVLRERFEAMLDESVAEVTEQEKKASSVVSTVTNDTASQQITVTTS